MSSLLKLAPVAVLTAALAFAAAGCGGSSQSAQEKWANDVCTQFVNWSKQMNQLVNDAKSAVQSPSASSIDSLKTDAQQAVNATKDLETNLKNLPPAPGSNGQSAKDALTTYANQVNQAISSMQSSVNALSSSTSLSQAATQLSKAAGQLSTFSTQTQSALDSAQQTSSDLKKGFQDASACQELKKQAS
jgi:hypothetical protein